MISPYKIKYNDMFSNELNLLDIIINVAFDSDSGETSTFLNREAVMSETHDGSYKRVHGYKYGESFSPKFTFIKEDFTDFTISDVRKVLKWLTSTSKPALLDVYYNNSEISWSAIGGWTEISTYKIANNRTIGITATFEAITPYAMSPLRRYPIVEPTVHDVTRVVDTTMYYWSTTLISGLSVPSYVLTSTATPTIGTDVYAPSTAIDGDVIDTATDLYGTISAVNGNEYTINGVKFTLTSLNTKIKRTYDNKISIDIDTDDSKPVFPRITIQQRGTIINIPADTTYTSASEIVENTVYFNGTTYYWKSAERVNSTTQPDYQWEVVTVESDYTDSDIIEKNKIYYYSKTGTYYWIDPYYFHTSPKDSPPSLATTSVRLTNKYTPPIGSSRVFDAVVVKNNTSTEKIVLDGANKIVSSSRTGRIFGDNFNWRWLELYDGHNEITIEGNCTVTLEWREIRKVGEY